MSVISIMSSSKIFSAALNLSRSLKVICALDFEDLSIILSACYCFVIIFSCCRKANVA